MNTIYAFGPETGIAANTERKCTEKYIEHGTEPIGRFMAKSLWQTRALLGFGKGGA